VLRIDQIFPRVGSIQEGDVIIGISSSGLHANGISLVRRIMDDLGLSYDMPAPFDNSMSFGDVFLTATRNYAKSVWPVIRNPKMGISGVAHISRGGLIENISELLKGSGSLYATLDANKWEFPAVFQWIIYKGGVDCFEMAKTFNCGVGMVLIVRKDACDDVLKELRSYGETAEVIGVVESKQPTPFGEDIPLVSLENTAIAWKEKSECLSLRDIWPGGFLIKRKVPVAVFSSGQGSNLQALIDSSRQADYPGCIVLVVSDCPNSGAVRKAIAAGIPYKILRMTGEKTSGSCPQDDNIDTLNPLEDKVPIVSEFVSQAAFESSINAELAFHGIEIVCLAGFRSFLSADFFTRWTSKLLCIHPSLLPAFAGHNVHPRVVASGVKLTGCTVFFCNDLVMTPDNHQVRSGPIIMQKAVKIDEDDTVEVVQKNVKRFCEWKCYPKALALLADGLVTIKEGKVSFDRKYEGDASRVPTD